MVKVITINEVEYTSSVKAAQFLVNSGLTPGEATKVLNKAGSSITYQSVFAYTVGAEKTKARRIKYRILNLGKSGRTSAGDIGKKTGVSTSKVVSMLRKAGIDILTKEAIVKASGNKEATKVLKKALEKEQKDVAKAKKKDAILADKLVKKLAKEKAPAKKVEDVIVETMPLIDEMKDILVSVGIDCPDINEDDANEAMAEAFANME